VQECIYGKSRGVSCGSVNHALPQRHPFGQRHHPSRRNPDELTESPGSVHSEIVTGDDHRIPGFEFVGTARLDNSCGINSRSMGIFAGNTFGTDAGKPVLVVQLRIMNPDQHLTFRQVVDAACFDFPGKLFFFRLTDDQGLKTCTHEC